MKIQTYLFMALCVASLGIKAQADITSGLTAHWTFDETNGLAAGDSSGKGNAASLINFPADDSQWVPGRINRALYFNGDVSSHDDYVLTDAPISFDNEDAFSFSFWMRRAPGATGTFPRVITPLNQTHWVLWGQGQGIGFHPPQLAGEPAIGVWQHYVVVFDRAASAYSVYLDGNQVLADVPIDRAAPGAATWIIGHNESAAQHGDHWFGALDDVRLYNRLLSADDVNELLQAAPAPAPFAPVVVEQPQGSDKFVGENYTFSAYADGDPAVTLQWQKNGQDIPNATNRTLSLTNLRLEDAGTYTLIARNERGTATSKPAVLQVRPVPVVADITSALVAHWTFDETNGLVAADASGNTNTASLVNFAEDDLQWVPGRVGGALRFNMRAGDVLDEIHGDYVVTDAPITFTNQDRFSFTFWIKREAETRGSFPRLITPMNQTHWLLWGGGNGVGFFPPPAIPEPVIGAWQHYVVTYDRAGSTYSVYRDGAKLLTDVPGVARSAPGEAYWILGHNESVAQHGDHWFGELDDVRIYSRLLTPADVDALFQSAPPVFPAIGQQSQGTFYKLVGQSATFSVQASGGQLRYQWKKGGQDILNATNSSLNLADLQLADAGSYTVVVSNSAGTLTGDVVDLQVKSPSTPADLTLGLAAHWKFDETNGLAALDSSGRTNSASLINFAGDDSQWVPGRIGGALRFNILNDGTLDPIHGNYVVTDEPVTLDNQDEFSFSFWINRAEGAPGTFPRVITVFNGPSNGWVLWGQGHGVGFHPPQLSADPLIGAWQHYVVVFNRAAGAYSVYVDGIKQLTDSPISKPPPGASNWIIGHNEIIAQDGDHWYGDLDDVRLYNRLLTDADVSALAELGGISPTIVMSITLSANQVIISWTGTGTLQSADQITGTWTDVPGATNPQTETPSGAAKFYRVRR